MLTKNVGILQHSFLSSRSLAVSASDKKVPLADILNYVNKLEKLTKLPRNRMTSVFRINWLSIHTLFSLSTPFAIFYSIRFFCSSFILLHNLYSLFSTFHFLLSIFFSLFFPHSCSFYSSFFALFGIVFDIVLTHILFIVLAICKDFQRKCMMPIYRYEASKWPSDRTIIIYISIHTNTLKDKSSFIFLYNSICLSVCVCAFFRKENIFYQIDIKMARIKRKKAQFVNVVVGSSLQFKWSRNKMPYCCSNLLLLY